MQGLLILYLMLSALTGPLEKKARRQFILPLKSPLRSVQSSFANANLMEAKFW
jgi:hypothetical protein